MKVAAECGVRSFEATPNGEININFDSLKETTDEKHELLRQLEPWRNEAQPFEALKSLDRLNALRQEAAPPAFTPDGED